MCCAISRYLDEIGLLLDKARAAMQTEADVEYDKEMVRVPKQLKVRAASSVLSDGNASDQTALHNHSCWCTTSHGCTVFAGTLL